MQTLNYTKLRLKPVDEILSILKEPVFIFSCKKCYIEFTEETEEGVTKEECKKLFQALNKENKVISGYLEFEFLCNEYLTTKKIQSINNFNTVKSVGVISCGIGIQLIADLLKDIPVYAFADSVPQSNTIQNAYHGIALTDKQCAACGQCYLNITSGICPIVECSKSLVNGPCGGAKGGKCEVKLPDGSTKDCAWEKILSRLPAIESIQLRDYSIPKYEFVNKHITENISRRKEGFYGGLYPSENKNSTENKQIEIFPEPEFVIIPLLQHTGAICQPQVKPGDKVKYGQKIGDSQHTLSATIHSSVSGEVIAIEERLHPVLGKKVISVVIKNDYKNTPDESIRKIDNFQTLTREEILGIIREKGIVGLGGAMFPTHIKLKPPKPVDTLLINGCECEPYLTCDYRLMIERTKEVLIGIELLLKCLGGGNSGSDEKAIIAIEDNKSEAIDKFKDVVANLSAKTKQSQLEFIDKIEVVAAKTKYPQGAERMLIKRVLGREVPLGGLPFDIGVIVQNVSTVYAIYDAVVNGQPLVKRVITVSGENCIRPGNYEIKFGTLLRDVIAYSFSDYTLYPIPYTLKMGGPMMGIIQADLDVPIIKGTTGIVAVEKPYPEYDIARKCIKCGRCVDVCPMELYPLYFAFYAKENKIQELKKYNVKSCIECGCCEYICSSKIPLVQIAKEAKLLC